MSGIDRGCNLGARKGDGGRERNFGVLLMVPESECSQGRGKEEGRKKRQEREED